MAAASPKQAVGAMSVLGRVYLKTLRAKLPQLRKAKLNVSGDEFRKYATSKYSQWFLKESGHKEAMSELKCLCDIIERKNNEMWNQLLDHIYKRVFFVHIVFGYITDVYKDEEICQELEMNVVKELEHELQDMTQVFEVLKMESPNRRMTVCKAVISTTAKDAIANDFAHTILHGVPLMRATEDAYDLLKKHFPERKISDDGDLNSLLEVIDLEISELEESCQNKTKEAEHKEELLDMMRVVANGLRRELEQKESEVQRLGKMVDNIDTTVKVVLEEVQGLKADKISNFEMTSSQTRPKEALEQDVPTDQLSSIDISSVGSVGKK